MPVSYTSASIVYNPHFLGTSYDTSVYSVSLTVTELTDGRNIVIDITNISDNTVLWPELRINLDHSGDSLTRYWIGQHKFDVHTYSTVFDPNVNWFFGLGAPQGLSHPVVCFDDGVSETIGLSSNYMLMHYIVPLLNGDGYQVVLCPQAFTANVPRVVPDFIESNQTKSITIWLRKTSSVGETAALEVLAPYIEFIQANYPYDNATLPRKRILGVNVSQHEAAAVDPVAIGGRQYWEFNGLKANEFSGWYTLLDAIVSGSGGSGGPYGGTSNLIENSYGGVMLWGINGYDSNQLADNYFPSFFRNMPTNLFNTVSEVAQWENDKDIKVYLWAGRAFSSIQQGNWNSALETVLKTGDYVYSAPENQVFRSVSIMYYWDDLFPVTNISAPFCDLEGWPVAGDWAIDYINDAVNNGGLTVEAAVIKYINNAIGVPLSHDGYMWLDFEGPSIALDSYDTIITAVQNSFPNAKVGPWLTGNPASYSQDLIDASDYLYVECYQQLVETDVEAFIAANTVLDTWSGLGKEIIPVLSLGVGWLHPDYPTIDPDAHEPLCTAENVMARRNAVISRLTDPTLSIPAIVFWQSARAGDTTRGQNIINLATEINYKIAISEVNEVGENIPISLNETNDWSLQTAALTEFINNIDTALQYFSGLGLDACPEAAQDPWIITKLQELRTTYPTKLLTVESHKTILMIGAARNCFFGANGFSGVGETGFDGRCPLTNAIYPDYRDIVFVYYNNDDEQFEADVQLIEENNFVPITMQRVMTQEWAGATDTVASTNLCITQELEGRINRTTQVNLEGEVQWL